MKNLTFCIFFVFLALSTLILSLFLLIKQQYVFSLLSFCLTVFSLMMAFICFAKYTNKFPLTLKKDFDLDLKRLKKGKENFKAIKQENGMWIIYQQNEELGKFNLNNYPFQISYIVAFCLIRINNSIVKKNNLCFGKTFSSCPINSMQLLSNFKITFINGKNTKEIFLIKNDKTKINTLIQLIMYSPFYVDLLFVKYDKIMYKRGVDFRSIHTSDKENM